MPTETEELRLVVNLVDNASAGVEQLRQRIGGLTSGSGGAATDKFKSELQNIGRISKGMASEVTQAGTAMQFLGGVVGGIGGTIGLAFGKIATEVIKSATSMDEWATKLRSMSMAARAFGIDPATFKYITEQLQQQGISAEAATRSLQGMASAAGDLVRQGSQLRFDILKNTTAESADAMDRLLTKFATAKDGVVQLNTALEIGQQVYRNSLRQTGSELTAREDQARILAQLGIDRSLVLAQTLKKQSAEEQALHNQRMQNADAYLRETAKMSENWGKVYDQVLKTLGLEGLMTRALTAGARGVNKLLEDLLKDFKEGNVPKPEDFSGTGKLFGGGRPGATGGPSAAEEKKSLDDNTDQLKKMNEHLMRMGVPVAPISYSPVGGPYGGLVQKAAYTPGQTYGGTPYGQPQGGYGGYPMGIPPGAPPGAQGGTRGYGGGAPYGSSTGGPTGTGQPGPAGDPAVPSDILATARRVALEGGPGAVEKFMAQQGYPKAGAWCGEFAASVVKSAGGTPPKNAAIASNWRNYGTEVDQPQPGDIAVRRGAPTGSTGSHVTIVSGVGGKTFTGLGGNQRSWESTYQTGRYQFFRGGGSTAGPGVGAGAGATAPSGGNAGAGLNRDAYDKMFAGTPLAGQYETVVAEAAKQGVSPSLVAGIMAHETGKGTSKMLRERLNPAGLMDPKTGMATGQTFGSIEQGIAAASRTIAKNYRRGGESIEGMAGIYAPVGAANDPRGLNRGWAAGVRRYSDALADRNQIDRSQTATTRVEGTGKLSVDVKAPKGTDVDAQGGGLFKDVEINRQTQMEPASRGPVEGTLSI